MAKLIETKITEVYEVKCPHCRSTLEHERLAEVTITRKGDGTLLDIQVRCLAAFTGQDRT